MKTSAALSTIREIEIITDVLAGLHSAEVDIRRLSSLQGLAGRDSRWAEGAIETIHLSAVDTVLSLEGIDLHTANSLLSVFGITLYEEDFI